MRRITTFSALILVGAFGACSSDTDNTTDTSTPTDTSVVGDTTVTDTGGDTLPADTTLPDIPSTPGTVKALQGEAAQAGCDGAKILTINPTVSLTEVVVTSPKYDAFTPTAPATGGELDGYYVADQDGGDFSGIALVIARSEATDFKPGDVLDIQGELVEYYCFTQIEATSYTLKTAVAAPAPIELQPADVGTEAHEGMLVKVSGVTVSEKVPGGYLVTGGLKVAFGFPFFLTMDVGATYDVTGVVNFAFGEFRLLPRTLADLKKQGGGTATGITAIQSLAESTGCTASSIQNFATGLEVTGVVTSNKISVAANLDGYFLSDGTQDDYSGILVTVAKALATSFVPGDVVKVTGKHVEYYCLTEISADAMEAATDTITAPAAVALANNLAPADLEKYEGMLVTFSNVTVGDGAVDHGGSPTDAGVMIDGYVMRDAFTSPVAGTVYSSVTGFLIYSFSNYRVSPRTAADLVVQ
ncbi:MAG: hypothetical protein CVU56_10015 [Deltaproteobacteria bacterium HGW-Deltaproteobacteria-14]|jgi:predicted extracellular nuclease|nr:MAG: hypothetical protein CVU56_10015 [Deltaproteobacteria bacterium HGW-Deltaproteobacteria-14]